MRSRPFALATLAVVLPLALAACGSSSTAVSGDSSGTTVAVTATDTECTLDTATVPAGSTSFAVTNSGDQVTEVYVYGEAEDEAGYTIVVAEVENIGPGTSRDMSADLVAGTYEVACKPGQTGDGIRAKLAVTGEPAASQSAAAVTQTIPLGIDGSDQLTGVDAASASTGDVVEFTVTNGASDARVFEVKRPDGSVAGETEIAAGASGSLQVEFTVAGDWLLIVEGGATETETTFKVA